MNSGPVILVLAPDDDGEASYVVGELQARGIDVVRLNLADFPERVSVWAQLTERGWAGGIDSLAGFYRRPLGSRNARQGG